MKNSKKKTMRQITIHFTDETAFVLDHYEAKAKEEMRTTEAQLLFDLVAGVKNCKLLDVEFVPNRTIDKLYGDWKDNGCDVKGCDCADEAASSETEVK